MSPHRYFVGRTAPHSALNSFRASTPAKVAEGTPTNDLRLQREQRLKRKQSAKKLVDMLQEKKEGH